MLWSHCSVVFVLNDHPELLTRYLCLIVSAERRVLHPSDCVYSESLTPQGKLVACRRDLTEILVSKGITCQIVLFGLLVLLRFLVASIVSSGMKINNSATFK